MRGSWLSRLNPLNSLFGRIFLWFWLTTVIMLVTTIWISRQMTDQIRYEPARKFQQERLQQSADKLQRLAGRRRHDSAQLDELLRRVGMREHLGLMLLSPVDGKALLSFPGSDRLDLAPFWALQDQQAVFSIDGPVWQFTGPRAMILEDKRYLLFVGRFKPPGPFLFARQQPWLMGLVILLTSAGLCALLAWSLLRPIGNLREATRAMARGDLQARAVKVASRQDEVGQLGREFNHMAEQLQRLVDSQKRILADISHELRSPLARLQVAIGIAQQEGNEESVHLLRIEQEAGRIDRMLEDVLTLARLDSGQQHLHWEILSLEALLGQLCDDIRFEARAYGKELTVQYPGEIKVRVDIRLFLSALENVLRNALKYARARIGLTITASGNGLAIRILDDGPGVADDQLSRLFDPFYRVSSARNSETGGTGLGLAIAAGAIASQGGTIVASNRAEGGLCVAIHLASVQWDAD